MSDLKAYKCMIVRIHSVASFILLMVAREERQEEGEYREKKRERERKRKRFCREERETERLVFPTLIFSSSLKTSYSHRWRRPKA